ncbi:MAG: hypothetical protein AAFP13_11365 [Pseudomonadota bacterium]
MDASLLIVGVSIAILAILVARAIHVVRKEKGSDPRGSLPGEGDHTIHAEYSSGLSGHHSSYKVPRDPQAYARRFVPRQKE